MDDALLRLEEEFCPPIDPALLSAILSDFDLNVGEDISNARQTLETLKAAATDNGAAEFDPSGTSAQDADSQTTQATEANGQGFGHVSAFSDGTDVTSLSSGMQGLEVSNASESDTGMATVLEAAQELDKLDNATKLVLLKEMFPMTSEYMISFTLKKCGHHWGKAMDELLNHVFFDENGQNSGDEKVLVKGIDGFSEDSIHRRRNKKRQKNTRRTTHRTEPTSPDSSSTSDETPTQNHWKDSREKITFISSRMNVTYSNASSLYYQSGTSMSAAIIAILKDSKPSKDESLENITKVHAFELAQDFPSVDPDQLIPLVRCTHPSTAAAHELAKILAAANSKARSGGRLEILTQYAPPEAVLEDISEIPWTAVPLRANGSSQSSAHAAANPEALARYYDMAHRRALSQVATARQRGRSTPLMAAAASYYSQIGRDYAKAGAAAKSNAADTLVANQSSANHIDLHGTTVQDAIRIAKAKTETWWQTKSKRVVGVDGRVMLEDNSTGAASQELRLITGLGRHSEGGKAKIGPAVEKMLLREGWNAVLQEGVVTVFGKKR